MKQEKKDLSISSILVYGILAELFLILLQFVYMAMYERSNPGTKLTFDISYMEHVGFFIFQIVGLFVFTIMAFFIFRRSIEKKLKKAIIFLVTGGIVELAFYLIITEFEPAYIYSILDKIAAIAFAAIIYWASQSKEDFKEAREH